MTIRRARTEVFNKLSHQITELETELEGEQNSVIRDSLYTKLTDLEDDLYDLAEDGIDTHYLSRLQEEGL